MKTLYSLSMVLSYAIFGLGFNCVMLATIGTAMAWGLAHRIRIRRRNFGSFGSAR